MTRRLIFDMMLNINDPTCVQGVVHCLQGGLSQHAEVREPAEAKMKVIPGLVPSFDPMICRKWKLYLGSMPYFCTSLHWPRWMRTFEGTYTYIVCLIFNAAQTSIRSDH